LPGQAGVIVWHTPSTHALDAHTVVPSGQTSQTWGTAQSASLVHAGGGGGGGGGHPVSLTTHWPFTHDAVSQEVEPSGHITQRASTTQSLSVLHCGGPHTGTPSEHCPFASQ
jgi:hypothetical protein